MSERNRVTASAATRVLGAVLLLCSVAFGVRLLGERDFGVAMAVLAAGQVIGFPLTALDRLMVRSASTGQHELVVRHLRWSKRYNLGLLAATLCACGIAFVLGESVVVAAAVGATAAAANSVATKQALNRAQGRIAWGQVPNEIARPAATIGAFVLVAWADLPYPGPTAILVASLVVLLLISIAPARPPRPVLRTASGADAGIVSAAFHLILLATVAVFVERGIAVTLGVFGTPSDVTRFTIVVRLIQVSAFAQAFGSFYYSPQIATALAKGSAGARRARQLAGRIRLVGLASAAPVATLCLLWPDLVARTLGSQSEMSHELAWAAVAVLAWTLSGSTQAYLVMAGKEARVAMLSGFALLGAATLLLVRPEFSSLTAAAFASVFYLLWSVLLTGSCLFRYGRII